MKLLRRFRWPLFGLGVFVLMAAFLAFRPDKIFVDDDTDIQNDPDLYVWLLAEQDFDGGSPTDYIDLGLIKGNVGGQNFQLPPDFDPTRHRSVLIWCLRFSVPFAAAPLA